MQVSPSSRRRIIAALLVATLLSSCVPERSKPAPVTLLGTRLDSTAGAVMVREGDNVWQISKRYRLPLRDIIDANNLQAPYALSTGQRLVLPSPIEHKVGADDTLYRLSRMYQVPVSQLVRTNNLSAPYKLNVGQQIRIPQGARTRQAETQVAQAQVDTSYTGNSYAAAEPLSSPRIAKRDSIIETVELAPPPSQQQQQPRPAQARFESLPQQASPAFAPQQPYVRPAAVAALGSSRPDFAWPVRGRVVSNYGAKQGGLYNDGINIAAPKGTPVSAAADGVVAYVGDGLDSYGNLVLIRHSGGMVTAYAHMGAVNVKKGAVVRKGQAIGTVGTTGTVANSQLHFEVRKGAETIDPKKFLG